MKEEIRKEYKLKRKALSEKEVQEKSKNAQKLFIESDIYNKASHIMLYMSFGNETKTDDIVNKALSDGKTVSVPLTDDKTGRITPVIIDDDTEFVTGAFGIKEPKNPKEENVKDIDTVLIPGVAFDKKGCRIGFGKGCYDMLLKNLNVTKAGFCYDFQLAENIPATQYDIPVDYIFTDTEVIKCK